MVQMRTSILLIASAFTEKISKRFILNVLVVMTILSSSNLFAKEWKTEKQSKKDCIEFAEQIPEFSLEEKCWIKKIYPHLINDNIDLFVRTYLQSITRDSTGYKLIFMNLRHLRSYTDCSGPISIYLDGVKVIKVKEINDSIVIDEP
jgi:hypothetical protein